MPVHPRKYRVELTETQRQELTTISRSTSETVLRTRRARVLLLADQNHPEGRRPDWQIGEIVGLTERQVERIRKQAVLEGIPETTDRKVRSDQGIPRTFDGPAEARLVQLCCSTPPDGHSRWTLALLVDEAKRLEIVATVCEETVRQTLKKTDSSRGTAAGSAFRRPTGRGSSHGWSTCWMSTTSRSTPDRLPDRPQPSVRMPELR